LNQLPHSEYSLSPKTKELARLLVQAWDEGKIKELSVTHSVSKRLDSAHGNVTEYILMPQPRENLENFTLPYQYGLVQFTELENCGLIKWSDRKSLLLFQTLRDAVNNDFSKSDNSTGFNINGNVGNINSNSSITNQQNIGVNYGVVNMTSQEIADELTQLLGQSLIDSHTELRLAIEALSTANEEEKPSRLKRVGAILGGMVSLGANLVTLSPAFVFIAEVLKHLS